MAEDPTTAPVKAEPDTQQNSKQTIGTAAEQPIANFEYSDFVYLLMEGRIV